MKIKLLFLILSTLVIGAQSKAIDKLKYNTVIDISESKGNTFLSLMQKKIKPALDEYATNGFKVANKSDVLSALNKVGKKVYIGAMKDSGGQKKLGDLVDYLNKKDEVVNLYNLPDKIATAKLGQNRYGLSTFLALASGGGVAVKVDNENYYYNVNYGTGKQEKDEMTGRSFGAGPLRDADDVSDKDYLKELEQFVRTPGQNTADFYRTLLQILTNCDTSGYSKISNLGQSVGTDFLAVYTAEEDRHLMDNMTSHAWDVALLEVTLLSAYHAGQDKIMVMFNGNLTDTVPQQAPGGEPRDKMRAASLIDWWQFSSNPDPKFKNRSGINVTKKDFRALGKTISNFERKNNPSLVAKLERHFTTVKKSGNLFEEISSYLINKNTPNQLGQKAYDLADDVADFLTQVQKDANKISQETLESQKINQ